MYLARSGKDAYQQRMDALWPGDVPPFEVGLEDLAPKKTDRARIVGDILVMYHHIEDARALAIEMGGTKTLGELFGQLAAIGYPRLAASDAGLDLRQRYWVVYKAIASEWEWVRIARVDWSHLRREAGLEPRGRKNRKLNTPT
jgi:hypothetical protein